MPLVKRQRSISPPRMASQRIVASHPSTPPRSVRRSAFASPASSSPSPTSSTRASVRRCSDARDGAEELPFHEAYFASQVSAGVAPALPPDTPAAERLLALCAWLRKGSSAILIEAPRASGGGFPGEYSPVSLTRMLNFFVAHCGARVGSGARFLDIGSGAGRPVFAAALSGAFASSAGIELNANREMCTWLAARFAVPSASFYRGDAGAWLPPGATHVYSFNRTFPPDALSAVAERLNTYPTWRFMVSSLDARAWTAHGLRGAVDVATLTRLHMAGSGSQHAMFVVARGQVLAQAARASASACEGGDTKVASAKAGDKEEAPFAVAAPPRVRRRFA